MSDAHVVFVAFSGMGNDHVFIGVFSTLEKAIEALPFQGGAPAMVGGWQEESPGFWTNGLNDGMYATIEREEIDGVIGTAWSDSPLDDEQPRT